MTEERNKNCCTGCASKTTIISIALNLFLVGVLAGPLFSGGRVPDGFRPPHETGFMLDQVARALPPEEGEKLRSIFEQERKSMKDHHASRHASMRKLADVIAAAKPDMMALRKVMEEIHAGGQGVHEGISRAMERIATEISPEGRKKIAEALRQDRGPPGGPPDHGPDDGPAGALPLPMPAGDGAQPR